MSESYPEFFYRVTKNRLLPYQERYALDPFSRTLLIVPTGLGKSDAVLMPWLYAQAYGDRSAPTRLILVLPRQNLTTQTAANARTRVETAGLDIQVLELLAGSRDNDEKLRPDQPTIIVATQDLYFSRALNRGYARRPPRWPIDFALYNQDCLIVLDEIQLMDDALATSTQLAAFRERFGTFGRPPCVWMSATVNPEWLCTVDFPELPQPIRLEDDDKVTAIVQKRYYARKALAAAPSECRTPEGCAAFAVFRHRPNTRTLVIANTVARAREIFEAVRNQFDGSILLHSQFRPPDRKAAAQRLQSIPAEGQIVVATQVLEAGVDITSRLLVTDIAPWGSMVQRFGRVNRYGDDDEPEIWWVDDPQYTKRKDKRAPYSPGEVDRALARLGGLTSAAPADLPEEDGPESYQHVLRKADLIDLFDTTPDLSGNELDVSRFIRAGDDKHVYLAWQAWEGNAPPAKTDPNDDELCPVPIGEFREFATKRTVFALNFATEEWERIGRDTPLYPGMRAVTRTTAGGYTPVEGWSPKSTAPVPPVSNEQPNEAETDTADTRSFQTYRQELRAHTDRVIEKMEELLEKTAIDGASRAALTTAVCKHDWGKAHEVFQATLKNAGSEVFLAKQCGHGRHKRKHFRHELGSALAMIQTGEPDLAAYLAAAHHGRVRLGIRSMPGEREDGGKRVARGIQDGDLLPGCQPATGVSVPEVRLSLGVMEFGAEQGSWTERMLKLRDRLGPFRLAYLEMLIRTADELASEDPGPEATACPQSN
jgi:CRISPR-associated endonuclease/helicase Cas3